jgi:hypothetical protein
MVFTLTLLYNHPHTSSAENFHRLKLKLCPPPWPMAATVLLSISMKRYFPGTSYKWIQQYLSLCIWLFQIA